MPKPPPPQRPLFAGAAPTEPTLTKRAEPPPQTITVEEVVESAKTGAPIAPEPTTRWATPEEQAAHEQRLSEPHEQPASETAPAAEQTAAPAQPQPQQIPVSYNPTNASELYRYVRMLARSSLLPKAFYPKGDYEKKSPKIDDVHFVCLKGQFLGLHPMISIGNINVIDGKAEVGALLMLAMVRKSGLMVPGGWKLVHSDMESATFATMRVGDSDWTPFTYTIEEARLMGLVDKGRDEEARAKNQWRLQPRTMLRRRCQSMLLREIYSDVVIGLYDHGELEEMRDREMALGVDPDRVIEMNGVPAPALPEPSEPGPIERLQAAARAAVDPLKERLKARTAAVPGGSGWPPRRCAQCEAELDARDAEANETGMCIGCRP